MSTEESTRTPTREELRAIIGEALHLSPDDLTGPENLIELGMESIVMMRLVNKWGRAGISVRYSDLLDNPTFDGWWDCLSRARR
ncbi:phosphopantetheine-binding protein [Streptomyces sp. NPDC019531]|uniref:phosphopantetheine-binding protein n=1 Tax=Streptomyces sp. NPDC019531 TaxID=3365062 RepID=UPI003851325D